MKKVIATPYIDQTRRYPTGCESVSAVMLLQYLGIPLGVDDFIERYLKKEPMIIREGRLYGPDPFRCFAGSPYDSDSFGCYPPVIVDAMNRVFADVQPERRAVDVTGMPMGELLERFIDRDLPVVFWASLDLKETVPGPEWYLRDGTKFSWISNEHCMLLVGYDEEAYYFQDPWMNHGCVGYPKGIVEKRHGEQREMAVVAMRRQEEAVAEGAGSRLCSLD